MIFPKSTRNGLLKNVQDGISRPLRSREIQKTKVEKVLVDTLYITTWMFLKSTQKELLGNVQNGISIPIGSQEIQKTKVETVLVDTLYLAKVA